MRNPIVFGIAIISGLLLGADSTEAGAMIDQSFDPTGRIRTQSDVQKDVDDYAQQAQTFRVGAGGRLTGADLLLTDYGSYNDGNLILQLRRTTALGMPSTDPADILAAANLAVSSIPSSDHPQFIGFHFGPDAPIVNTGDSLALVLLQSESGAGLVDWSGSDGNLYPLGHLTTLSHQFYHDVWSIPIDFNDGLDGGFRTYIEPVPEPSSLLMAGTLLGSYSWFRFHRRSRDVRRPI